MPRITKMIKNDISKKRVLSNTSITILAGITQATLVTFIGQPFDLVKTKLHAKLYPSTREAISQTFRTAGVRGFYKGASMPWLSHLLKRPMQFTIAEKIKLKNETWNNPYINNFTTGAFTGSTGTIFGTPLQCIKVNMQTNDYKNISEYIKHNYRINGLRGFYKGVIATAMKDSTFGASFLGFYHTFRDNIGEDKLFGPDKLWKNFIGGASAHCLTWAVLMPIDFIKTSIQRSETKLTVREVIVTNFKEKGIRVFWKGLLPACLRTIPVSGFGMTGYEYVRSFRYEE